MLILDSDLISILMKGPPSERTRLLEWLRKAGDDAVVVTIISFEEQMRGWMAAIAKAKTPQEQVTVYLRLRVCLDDYRRWSVVDFNVAAADRFADLRRSYRRLGAADLKIASICLCVGAKLLSRNTRDFKVIEGLTVENPLAH